MALTQEQPSDDHRRRDAAVQILIRACQMDWGSIEFSTWDRRAVAVRALHSMKPSAPPRPLPTEEEILAEDVVQEAARILSDLYRAPRAVFTIQVSNGGNFSHFAVGNASTRIQVAWSDQAHRTID